MPWMHRCSRPVPDSCHYFGQHRLISHVGQTFNDKNGARERETRLTTCMRSCKSQDWNEFKSLSRIQNPVVLLVKKFFVCRPIKTRDSEVDTRKTRFWCVEIENPCVTCHILRQQIFAVHFFDVSPFFGETIFVWARRVVG